MEILRLYAEKYCHLATHAQSVALFVQAMEDGDVKARVDAEVMAHTLIPCLTEMKEESKRIGLEATCKALDRTLAKWERYPNSKAIGPLCTHILMVLDDELRGKICLIFPPISQTLYESPTEGWERILEVFPEAQDDIEQMNRCVVFGCHSAAVFHALLVVEFGLIKLGKFLGSRDPKPGWDASSKALDRILGPGGRAAAPPRIRKHYAFLELVNKDMHSMKLAWRNKVNHAANNLFVLTSDFKPQVAEKIISACHGFMLLLATEGPIKV
ncbi:MAG: hypothetical protein WAM85_18280 [Terracidiphilus sp.]